MEKQILEELYGKLRELIPDFETREEGNKNYISYKMQINDKDFETYRNNFIKQLLRVYLCFVLPGCYTAQENLEYFAEREKGIFGEREVVPAPISRYVREKTSEQKRVTEAPIEVGGVVIKDLPPEKPEDVNIPETKGSFGNSRETDPLKESPNEGMEPEVQEDTSLQDSLNDELAKTGNSNDEEESELMGLFKNMVI